MRPALTIILGSVALACALGLCLDLVTAHVAVEYFTVHHPKVVESREPLVMAVVWGIGASWWFGLIAGMVLALVNWRLNPSLSTRRVLVMIAKSCVVLWLILMLILVGIYFLANLVPPSERDASFESNRRLMAVAVAHSTEYVLGGLALLIVALRMRWLSRRGSRILPPQPI